MHSFEKFYRESMAKMVPEKLRPKIISDWIVYQKNYQMFNQPWPDYSFFAQKAASMGHTLQDALTSYSFTYALFSYQFDKRIYDINNRLFNDLTKVSLPEKTPTKAMYLPENHAMVFSINEAEYFYHISRSTTTEGLVWAIFKLKSLSDGRYAVARIGAISEKDFYLSDAIDKAETNTKRLISLGQLKEGDLEEGETEFSKVCTLLLYIKADKDVVKQVHPGEKPIKHRGWSGADFNKAKYSSPDNYIVGDGYAQIIEHWEHENLSLEDRQTRNVRPHIRRPHAHLYHTKNGPVVYFLPPISVLGADLSKFDPHHPMKILVK